MFYFKLIFLFIFIDYTWEVEFPEDNHLIKSESRKKQYYFNYYQTETTYKDARKVCQSRGNGWDLAAFQTKPILFLWYDYDKARWQLSYYQDDYDKSVKNIE